MKLNLIIVGTIVAVAVIMTVLIMFSTQNQDSSVYLSESIEQIKNPVERGIVDAGSKISSTILLAAMLRAFFTSK